MATDPKDPKGVKSYDAPQRTAPAAGRLIGIVVAVIAVVLLLIWLF